MLEMPTLAGVPRSWTLHQPSTLTARAALALIDAGAILNAPLTSTAGNLVQLGLKRWLDARTTGMRHFNFTLHYREFTQMPHAAQQGAMIEFESVNMYNKVIIGPGVTALERSITGLGQAVLRTIDSLNALLPVTTPAAALRMASWHYWGGYDDEKETLAEYESAGEDPRTIDIVKRADVDKHIPRWASQPQIKISRRGLEYLAGPRRTRYTGKVARALIALLEAIKANETRIHFAGADPDQIVLPQVLFLRWSRQDPMLRIFDDWANDEAEAGEYREHLAHVEAGSGDKDFAQAIAAFLAGIEPLFPILRALDALLTLLERKS